MKLSTFHVLCYLCVLIAFVLSTKSDWKNQPVSNSSSRIQETRKKPLDASNPRDKRALGLILSGLAQVFGYTVNPVQIASLPNPATESGETRGSTQSSGTQANSTQSNGSSTTAAPRQRETIRFTGVVNFGNGTGVLTHLQQYEALFHGGNNNSISATTSESSATQSPQVDPRPPLVVKIPLPIVPQPNLQPIPQPPLPEIPPQDIMLSYPAPIVPVRKEQQMRRKNLTEKVTVQNQTIQSGMDVRSQPPSTTVVVQTEDPRWKKEYEDRLAELERKQEEQAKRLKEQEWYRNRQKENNYNYEEDGKEYDDRGKQIGEQHSECRKEEEESDKGKESEEEENQSRENEEKIREYSTSQKTKKPEESEEEEEGYQNYKNDDVYKKDMPQLNENYTSIQSNEPLPLSEDDEQRRPEDLRNSYGEPLYNRELFDDGFVNFFRNQPLRDIYNSPFSNSKEKISEEEEDPRENQKHEDRSDEREEKNIPARNKYEEYSLEEDTNTKRKDENDFEPSKKYFTNVQTNSKNQFEERGTIEEMEFGKYMPLIVPVRYLSVPEELAKEKSKEKSLSMEKSEKDNNILETGITKKTSKFKESWRSKKENLKPIIGLPEKPRQLHEGEQKDLQIWPPPFDFVLDSTIHTNVVQTKFNHNDSIEIPNIRQKPESFSKKKEKRQQRNRILNNSTQKSYDSPEDIYYQRFKNDHKHKIVSEKRLTKPINAERSNHTHFKIEVKEVKKFEQNDHGKELPQFHEHYKYISNNNYKNTERPNIDVHHSSKQQIPNSLHFKNFESLKYNIEKNEPGVEDKNRINRKIDKNQIIQDVQQKSDPPIIFDPRENYNFFDFNENVHDFNHGRENDRLSEVFESNKRMENKRAIGLTIPQQDVYHYDESLTKFFNEPESKSVKVRENNYSNGALGMKMHQERIAPSESISYINYPSIL